MAVLKYRSPTDGLFYPVSYGGTPAPNEVTVAAAQPADGSELWLDTDEPSTVSGGIDSTGDTMTGPLVLTPPTSLPHAARWADGLPRFATVAERDTAYTNIGGPVAGMQCFVNDLTTSISGLTYRYVSGAWKVVEGDTGWRNINTLLAGGWTARSGRNGLSVRRVADLVTVYADALIAPGANAYAVPGAIPGFMFPFSFFGVLDSSGWVPIPAIGHTNGTEFLRLGVDGIHIPAGMNVSFVFSLFTLQAWPTSLPGAAVTPASDFVADSSLAGG